MYRTEKSVRSSRQIFVEIIELYIICLLDKIEKKSLLTTITTQLTLMCTVHDPWKTLINQYLVPEEMCGKKMNGQTDSHTDTDTHHVGRTEFRFQVFKILLILKMHIL